jgi:hypothetical protein
MMKQEDCQEASVDTSISSENAAPSMNFSVTVSMVMLIPARKFFENSWENFLYLP